VPGKCSSTKAASIWYGAFIVTLERFAASSNTPLPKFVLGFPIAIETSDEQFKKA